MRKSTKETDFGRSVKIAISERDSIDGWPCCVNCGAAAPAPLVWSNAHFIPRSHGGRGIEENGLTLCPPCHRKFDQTVARKELKQFFRDYLKSKYPDWDEEKLYYRRYANDPV